MNSICTLSALRLAALLANAAIAHAQCLDWGSEFQSPGTNGVTHALTAFDDGSGPRLALGGTFTFAGSTITPQVAAFDGASWQPLGAGLHGAVHALTQFDDGSGPALIAGGAFDASGATPLARIARWTGQAWAPLGAGLSGTVRALEAFDAGAGLALHAGGDFGVARWDGTNWTPVAGLAGQVHALCGFDDGSGPALYVGGLSLTVNGLPGLDNVARWNGSQWQATGGPNNGLVRTLTAFDDGAGAELFAGGVFYLPGSGMPQHLARWDGSTWSHAAIPGASDVTALRVFDDGSGAQLFATTDLRGIVARSAGIWSTPGSGISALAHALAAFDDGSGARLFASVSSVPDANEPRGLVAWDGATWTSPGAGAGFSGRVYGLESHDDGSARALYAIGSFTAGDASAVNSIARFDGAVWTSVGGARVFNGNTLHSFGSSLVAGFSQLHVGGVLVARNAALWDGVQWTQPGALNNPVYAFATWDAGSGPELYAGGAFDLGGAPGNIVPLGHVARWDGAAWRPLGSGIASPGPLSPVLALTGFGKELYAGGHFTLADGGFDHIARWNGGSWNSVGGGVDGTVRALAEFDDGTGPALYVGGTFTVAGGILASNIARWNGSTWTSVGGDVAGGGVNASVRALEVHDDGAGLALFAAGDFTQADGTSANRIARWNGTSWSALGAGLGDASQFAWALAQHVGRNGSAALHVGGDFTLAGTQVAVSVARWSGCAQPIDTFCAGDGELATACPCGNNGAADRGCAWSNGAGAALAASGATNPDTIVLTASSMPAATTAIFLKGDAAIASGVAFGDGVRCLGGTLIRLGSKTSAAGSASFPEPGNAPVSVRGLTPPGSGLVGYYQTYYRNAASFCTSATFNATNGARIVW